VRFGTKAPVRWHRCPSNDRRLSGIYPAVGNFAGFLYRRWNEGDVPACSAAEAVPRVDGTPAPGAPYHRMESNVNETG
jgi:hypothetical protein